MKGPHCRPLVSPGWGNSSANSRFLIRPIEEEIARRAYELYLDRGQTPDHELEDWLKAEWELSENWGQ